ncbi:unnamed protein product [Candida verbasci]|uniref:AB hydrolase-1 domain-containing protein n=1 Tax=Candida verbasci TaxID=1227364 RepID=A0A9W4XG85_9ASCO|nr:unnamed protein product [Candida verbasci]
MIARRIYSTTTKLLKSEYSKLRDNYKAPKYPIVLCHGFSGFDRLSLLPRLKTNQTSVDQALEKSLIELDYWYGIKNALEKLGSTVFVAKVPAFGDIKSRAMSLDKFINKKCDHLRKNSKEEIYTNSEQSKSFKQKSEPIKINLIAHSMGGLDSRYLISKIQTEQKNYKVASLTTISTPHHGSEAADFIVDLVKQYPLLKSICPHSIFEMTTKNMKNFNKSILDDPEVKYLSFGARFNPRWYNLFSLTWVIMKYQISKEHQKQFQNFIDNDGLVTVESSKWGHYIGTLDQVDHLDVINWTNRIRAFFMKLMFAQQPAFNPIALYLDIANELAKKGL